LKLITTYFYLAFTILSISQTQYAHEKSWIDPNNNDINILKNDFQNYTDSTFLNYRKNLNFEFAPHLEYALENSKFYLKNGFQTNFFASYKYLIDVFVQYNAGYINRANTIYESTLQAKSFFFNQISSNNFIYQDLRTRINWKPSKYFELQTGIDKNHIGEGDRSLLIGNQGVSNPFALMKFNFWKFEYISMHQIFREGKANHYIPKGNSSHLINFKWNKKFSIGIFENVTHVIKDTLYNRGFEVEYLNPLIFYRPQEYALGSADNVNIGLNFHYTFKNSMIYGQFILDEFLLSELRARSRWQHNKYGGQIGFKKWTNFNQKELFFRTEFNIVRPFTYSHTSINTNFANQGLPVAHPLGANFIENYTELFTQLKHFNLSVWTQIYIKGNDAIGSNVSNGGDIYQSYFNKPLGKDKGYTIGFGEKTYRFQYGMNISKLITKHQFNCYVEPRIVLEKRHATIESNYFITFGIVSRLYNDKRNY
jgi:hypothetical protein